MSSTVTRRLAEMAERGRERRQRTGEIRQESLRLFEQVRHVRPDASDAAGDSAGQERVVVARSDGPLEEGTVLGQVRALLGGDVLDQVQTVLCEADRRVMGQWNEDDTCILLCFEQVWAAAGRKGYTLEDLQKVLKSLEPPQQD